MLGTVSKAARVLGLFTREHSDWGVSEVARELGLPKSSAHSLLTTLADTGLLQHTDDNRYRLGWRILSLGRHLLDSNDVRMHAQTTIQTLVERFGTTVHLATLDEGQVTYLDKVQGRSKLAIPVSGVGRRVPAHCSALGKVLLAYQPWPVVEGVAEASALPRFTPNTICSLQELRVELSVTRHTGFAKDEEEIVSGLCCFSAPILDVHHRALAAISVSIPTSEYGRAPDRYARLAVAAGKQVSRSLRVSVPDELVRATGDIDPVAA